MKVAIAPRSAMTSASINLLQKVNQILMNEVLKESEQHTINSLHGSQVLLSGLVLPYDFL